MGHVLAIKAKNVLSTSTDTTCESMAPTIKRNALCVNSSNSETSLTGVLTSTEKKSEKCRRHYNAVLAPRGGTSPDHQRKPQGVENQCAPRSMLQGIKTSDYAERS